MRRLDDSCLTDSVESLIDLMFLIHQGKKGAGDPGDVELKKFDGAGYDSDLVDLLERDIVSRNPNVHWLVAPT